MQKARVKISKFGKFSKTTAKETLVFVLKVFIGLATILLTIIPVPDGFHGLINFCAQTATAILTQINQVILGSGVSIKLGGKHLFLVLKLEEKEDDISPGSLALIIVKEVVVSW